ncbi:hypothetical protein ACFQ8S_06865 [Streptomyces virginiae]|uniref:hypothetical protein n=1 Tax=Streptomyces virginiae TaxID=1961 RepID=UPI0036BB8426
MSAAKYRVIQTKSSTGGIVEFLPALSIDYSESLNGEGTCNVAIPLKCPEADPLSLIPGISGLAILRDNEPVWVGVIWTMSADLDQGTLTLHAAGYLSYYRGRVLHDGYIRQADQSLIMKEWINDCNVANGVNTTTTGVALTGRESRRSWTQYELKNIGEAMQELAEDDGGFNFRFAPYWKSGNGAVGNKLVISPRGGAEIPSALVHTENCNITAVSYDSAAMATRVYALGADNGNGTKLVGIQDNFDLDAVMPTKHVVASFTDVKQTETLIDKAAAMISAGREPVAIPTLTLYPGAFNPGTLIPGDTATVQADSGYVALFEQFVLTERRTTVDVNGTEITTLALANKELFISGD